MKKFVALLLVLVMVLSLTACGKNSAMTYEQFAAAAMDTEVTVETYVQATQSWWENKITAYCQSKDGAYFAYELTCTEEEAAKLVPGTKIKITGTKGEWAGEVEIMDGKFEIVKGGDTYIAEAMDATALLGKEELIKHQNKLAKFAGLTVAKIEYKNGEPGDDIYLTLALNGAAYNFCVERYLTGPDSDVYKAVATLKVGDVVDVEGFLYWYEGVNPHITKITVKDTVMTHKEYADAAMDADVKVATFVQATQSWWDNKITAYCQTPDGACFAYEMACAEADAAKLVPGTLIKITGTKGAWAGEVEIMDGKFEIIPGNTYIAEAFDATDLLAKDELINHQNKKVAFKDMKVKKIEYKNGEPGDDIYVTLDKDGNEYSFCIEIYLTGKDTDVYKAVGELKAGDVIDVEGFLYWYEGANPHITAVTKK